MDKNTIIGLSLIGVILVAFTIFNQPSPEEVKAQQKKELAEMKAKAEKAKITVKNDAPATANSSLVEKKDAKGNPVLDAAGNQVFTDTVTKKDTVMVAESVPAPAAVKAEIVRLESEKYIVELSTKGGIVSSVQLKEFETFKDFHKNDGKITPLYLFREGDQVNELVFPLKGTDYRTGNKQFTVKEQTADRVVLEHAVAGGSIDFVYELKGGYDLDFTVKMNKLGSLVQPENVALNWNMAMRKTERLLSEQRKVSTICYQLADGEFSYLNEISNDSEDIAQPVDWVAYKQSYFSSILKPEKPFRNKNNTVKAWNFKEGQKEFHTHIRGYKSALALPLASTNNGSVKMHWFFGPNDYTLLKSYDSNYDDILNFGWGLFRWINLYAVQPVFDLLSSTGMGIGLAILLLTLVLKLILMPVQWKMFVSSAKMRILKPDIDAINAKYPNKEDAMKKQMDMMALYRESGASPLSGCVPMLFQMPILLAVFRFFPAAFELRQQSFLWAEDLSSYDSIYNFGSYIPMYGDHISLFTLLMAATTLIYTYLNSSNVAQQQQPGMPNMKVIMYIFPVMMIFFFNNFAAGLSYYYFISTLMTIVLMLLIKQFFVDEEKLKAKMAAVRVSKANAGPKKKSKFMERMEEMQRQQQDMKKRSGRK
jgi:YidC/Oxa1 family membrane protein insertase